MISCYWILFACHHSGSLLIKLLDSWCEPVINKSSVGLSEVAFDENQLLKNKTVLSLPSSSPLLGFKTEELTLKIEEPLQEPETALVGF